MTSVWSRPSWRHVLALPLAATLLAGAGCKAGNGDECLTNRQFFAQKVWGEVVSKKCIRCHSPEGTAAEQNAKLLLLSPSFPGFIDANLSMLTELGKLQKDGKSWIIYKPLGGDSHGGGKVFEEGSEEQKILQEMMDRSGKADSCAEAAGVQSGQVSVLTPTQTLRKAALALVGRLPTVEELQQVEMGGEGGLDPVLDSIMTEEPFYSRMKEIYNDVFLTNVYRGQALGLLNDNDFPGKYWWNPNKVPDNMMTAEMRTNRDLSDFGVASEPIELVAHIIRHNKPFTEILTADYVVVNPQSAQVYGLDPATLGFKGTYGYTEFREARVKIQRKDGAIDMPHAGVLTTTTWLHRYPTTTTNLNRARARMTYKMFLATDLLRVAERPIDPSSVVSQVPTRDDPYCKVCHKIIDPMAAAFQKWDQDGRLIPDAQWPKELPIPGFGQGVIDNLNQYPAALQWLGKQVTADNRFITSTVYTVYKGLTGQEPFSYPADPEAPDFQERLVAYTLQDSVLRAAGEKFKADNYNMKTLVKALIHSTAYRAVNGGGVAPGVLEGLGTGRFLTPELLDRKITAITRVRWAHDVNYPWLLNDYQLLYGGIDNVNVINRLTEPNGVMSNVALRMASEVACQSTAWDLVKPRGARTLFPYVELTYRPEDENGYPVPKAVQQIRENIRYLHAQVLGEELALDDPEIERTYQLYVKTYRELLARNDNNMPYECRGRYNPETGRNAADGGVFIDSDKYFTVKPWIAVMAYLLSDYRFLYE